MPKADFHNVVVNVEFILQTPEGEKPNLENVEKELISAVKRGLWIHASMPRIVHTVTEEISDPIKF